MKNSSNKTNRRSSAGEGLSYFRLSLLSYLRDSHPDRVADRAFIASRGDAAAAAYSQAVKSGDTHDRAEEIASEVLYAGLHFSPYRTVVNILWNEFTEEVDMLQAEELAKKLLPRLASIFEDYPLNDDFADSAAYRLLYTELVGEIQILIEDGRME